MIYMDTSALVKLIVQEPESAPLRRWLADAEDRDHATSAVGRVELMRTALRSGDTEIVANAKRILHEDLDIVAVTDEVIYELMGLTGQEYVDIYAATVKERSNEAESTSEAARIPETAAG